MKNEDGRLNSGPRRVRPWLMVFGLLMAFASAFHAFGAGCYPAPAGLVGWWPSEGNGNDLAGANSGTLQGGADANAPGLVGSAFTFDGTNAYVQIADAPALRPTNLTVEAWVLFSSLESAGVGGSPAGQQYIVFKQNTRSSFFEGYNLSKNRVAGGDVLEFIISSASGQLIQLQSATRVATGVWYHVTGVRGSNFVQLYVNGQLERQTNVSFAQDYGDFPLYFGTSGQAYWDHKFRGLLDEVSLYKRALSSNEIAAVYAAGAAGKCKGASITTQPQSQAVVSGTSAVFTVTALGFGSLSYQWAFNGASLVGATNANLTLSNVQPANAGNYRVVVTNSLGSVTSLVATLTVWVPPAIVAQPQSRTNIIGTDASFGVSGSGTPPPGYQWQFNGAAIPGATGTALLRSAVSFIDAGGYSVVLTNVARALTSTVAMLTVVCPTVTLGPTALPSSVVGSAYNQSLTASGGLGAYTFAVTAGTLPTGLSLSGAGNLSGIPTALGTNSFTVTATDTNSCSGSQAYTLAVTGAPPVITLQPQSRTNIVGTDASFSVSGSGTPPPGYQWQFNGAAIPGATGTALLRSAVSFIDAGGYSVVLTSLAGALTSTVATLTVVCPTVTLGPTALPSSVVGSAYNQSLTASGGLGAYTFAVTAGTLPTGLSLSGAGNLSGILTALGTNSFTVTATDTNSCSGSQAYTLAVTGAPPVITLQPQSRTNIVGTDASFSVSGSGTPPPGYQWQFNGAALPGATGTTLLRSAVSFADAGQYQVVLTNLAGALTSTVATLTVVCPTVTLGPTALPSSVVGSAYNQSLTASGGLGAYTFAVTAGTLPTGLSLSGAGNLSGILTALGTNSFTVTATDTNSCSGSQAYTLAVTGAPPFITLQPQSRTNIAGTAATFAVAAVGTAPLGYQWQVNGATIPGATDMELLLPNVQPTNAGSYTVVVTNAAGAVTSAVVVLTVTGPPVIEVQPASLSISAGTSASFSVTASGTEPLGYLWRFNGVEVWGATGATLLLTNAQPGNAGSYLVVVTNAGGSATSVVATLAVNLVAPCVSSPAGLIGWWPGEGNANDIAGTNPGALQGSATANTAGVAGSAFKLNGTNGYVQISDSVVMRPTNLTIEAWVRFSSLNSPASGSSPAGEQYIVFKQNTASGNFEGFALTKTRVTGRDYFDFQVSSASGQAAEITSVTTVSTGVWYHVAAVRGSNYLQLYVNGQLERQTNVSFPQNYGSYPLYFGTSGQTSWDHKFAGELDEVSLYNRALSSTEVAAIHAAGAAGKCKAVAILAQPQNQTVAVGANVSLTVSASGSAPLSYQWQRNGLNLANGASISGVYSSVLNLANVSLGAAADYRVVLANLVGAATSAVAVLEVVPELALPSITTQPVSQTAPAGTNVTFTVSAVGFGLSYQWLFNGTPVANGGQAGGAASPTLAVSSLLPANSGAYSVVVTNSAGSVTSTPAILTVTPAVNCGAAPPGLVGWWPGDGNGNDIAGTNNGTFQGGATADAQAVVGKGFSLDGTNKYIRIPDSPALRPAELTVECWAKWNNLDVPGTSVYPGQQYLVFKQNSRATDFEAYVLSKDRTWNDIILWEVTSASGELVRIDSTSPVTTNVWYHLAGVRGSNYIQIYFNGRLEAQTNVNFPQDYGDWPLYFGTSGQSYYDRKLNGVMDEVALYNRALSANEIAALYAMGAAGKCKGTNGILITAQPQSQAAAAGSTAMFSIGAGGITPFTYQWQFNGTPLVGAVGSSLSLTNVQPAQAGAYSVVVANSAGLVTSEVAILEVVPELALPSITTQPASQKVAAGTKAAFSVSAAGLGLSYQWLFNGTPVANGGQVSGAASSMLAISSLLPANSGTYSVVVANSAGSVTSTPAILNVTPAVTCGAAPPGLVGWWPGDGNVNDIAGTNNGTFQGGATADAQAMVGKGFSLDGTNKYIRIPDSPVLKPAELTVECWVKWNNLDTPGTSVYPGQQYIVFKQNARPSDNFEGYVLSKDRTWNDIILWEVTSASGELVRIDSTSPVTTNVWYHLAGVRGSNYIQIYFNEHLEAQTNVNFPQSYGNWPLYFGTSGQSFYDRKLNGVMDEVALYNRALSANEIAALYAMGAAGKCKGTNGVLITTQPQSQTAAAGSDAMLTVGAGGLTPFTYQWQFNGTPLEGAVGSRLSLTNVQPAQAGGYSVLVANNAGLVTSEVALLTVAYRPLLLNAKTTPEGAFGFTLSGAAGLVYEVEITTNFFDWEFLALVTNTTGQTDFTDPAPSNSVPRSYRARWAP